MKTNIKKIISSLLAIIVIIGSTFTFNFQAYAVALGNETVAAEISEDEIAVSTEYDAEENTAAGENPEPVVTEPCEEPSTAAPTTAPATVASTTSPTTSAPTTKPAPTVGKVKNITKTSTDSNKITLKWDKVNGAKGYVIYYRNVDKTTKYTKYKTVTTNSVTVTGLTANTPYYFQIAAYVTQDGKTYEGTAATKKTATQPAAVTNLTLKDSSSNISFSWSKVANADGYKIYRACNATNAKYILYKTIKGGSTTSFVDKSVKKPGAYYYQIRAYRSYSETGCTYHSAISTLRTVCGLGSTKVSMTSQLWRVSLSWSAVTYANGYDIYYSTSKTGTYTKLASTTNSFYNTKKLTNGKTYYFKVMPYRLVGKAKTKVYGTYSIVSKKVSNLGYGTNVGTTYIEISLKQQHMWMYVNGKLYVETDIVTGNDDGIHNTPKGTYKIWQRQSPATLVGSGYSCRVSYWLAFTYSGCGIHDASWRSSSEYGGSTYKGNGSHGCVNTPYDKVKKIYSKAKIGTYVVVY